jgi:hypothetical protein
MEIPGNTRANPGDQTYAASSLFETATATAYAGRCNDFKVLNTQYLKHKSEFIWTEDWTIEACGKKYKKTVTFGPHGNISHGLFLEEIK